MDFQVEREPDDGLQGAGAEDTGLEDTGLEDAGTEDAGPTQMQAILSQVWVKQAVVALVLFGVAASFQLQPLAGTGTAQRIEQILVDDYNWRAAAGAGREVVDQVWQRVRTAAGRATAADALLEQMQPPVEGTVVRSAGTSSTELRWAAGFRQPVHAVLPGRVIKVSENERYGLLVEIAHEGALTSQYAHLAAVSVEPDDIVAAGDVIARVGASGDVQTPQLLFRLWRDGQPVDPVAYLNPAAPAADSTADEDR